MCSYCPRCVVIYDERRWGKTHFRQLAAVASSWIMIWWIGLLLNFGKFLWDLYNTKTNNNRFLKTQSGSFLSLTSKNCRIVTLVPCTKRCIVKLLRTKTKIFLCIFFFLKFQTNSTFSVLKDCILRLVFQQFGLLSCFFSLTQNWVTLSLYCFTAKSNAAFQAGGPYLHPKA